jgi:hypothetical protein
MNMMNKMILLGATLATCVIGNSYANNLAGLVICSAVPQPFVISCNGKSAPPVSPTVCLPATWKAMATVPELFGGTPEHPVTHLTCEWRSTTTGEKIVSTVMDILDDHAGNFPSGKVSNIELNKNYIFDPTPNPIPSDYTVFMSVVLRPAKA